MVSAGQVIRASDVSVQACRVTRLTAQALTDVTLTVIAFNDEQFDTDGMHDNSTNNSRITINTAGIYDVGFHGVLDGTLGSYARLLCVLRVNGTLEIARHGDVPLSGTLDQTLGVSTVYQFDAGDYIEALVYQDSAGTRDLEATADTSPIFYAARIGS